MRLVGDISWQEFDQLDNFDRRLKFLKISSTTYIENKQYTEFLALQPQFNTWLVRVLVVKFFKLLGATYKVLGRVLGWVQIVTFLLDIVFQRSLYQFIGQYFINFLFVVAINLNRQWRLILLSRQWVICSFPQLIQ